jgi:hypothetical protein
VQQIISIATLLCQRSMESEKLWFSLLDRFVKLQRSNNQQEQAHQAYPPRLFFRSSSVVTHVVRRGANPDERVSRGLAMMGAALTSFSRTVLDNMMGCVPGH